MKKDGIHIMLIGLGVTILTAILYFSKSNEYFMSKFIIGKDSSFHFNWAPMIGISIMAFGEFLLWESQKNENLNQVRIKFINWFYTRLSNLHLYLIYISHTKLLNMKAVRFIISVFNI